MGFFFYSLAPLFDSAVTTAKIADGAVTNAKVNGSAAIAFSKLASLTSARLLVGSAANVPTAVDVTGDVTISNAGVTAIGASKVTEAMQVLADNTTNDLSTTKHGYSPKAPNDTTKFLRGDASWAVPTASTQDFVKMHSQQGATSTGGEEILFTKTFAASDFAANDLLVVAVENYAAGAVADTIKVEIYDGTNTYTSSNVTDGSTANPRSEFSLFFIRARQDAATGLACCAIGWGGAGALTDVSNEIATMIASWITSAFTLRIKVNDGANTYQYKYWAWKLKA